MTGGGGGGRGQVVVAWIAALQGSGVQPPMAACRPEGLSLLNHFGHTWWRLGDRSLFPREGEGARGDIHNCCEIIGAIPALRGS